MVFTSKDEYGLKAVIYLAMHEASWPVQAREIAAAEKIPEQFLEHVLAALRRGGVVRSIRGAAGGYELAGAARDIRAGDVLRAVSGPIAPVRSADGDVGAESADSDVIINLRLKVQQSILQVLDNTSIQDLVDEKMRQSGEACLMMNI